MTWSNTKEFSEKVQNAITAGLQVAYCSVDTALQRAHLGILESLKLRIETMRNRFIEDRSERPANMMFRAQMLVSGTRNYIELWIHLKESDPQVAWEKLVDAESDFQIAQRIHSDELICELLSNLIEIETAVFPCQHYFSSGYTFAAAACSICGSQYGDCDHLRGCIYMGKICSRVIDNFTICEASVVTSPRDKRCRIVELRRGNVAYCTLTGRERPISPSSETLLGSVHGTLLHFD